MHLPKYILDQLGIHALKEILCLIDNINQTYFSAADYKNIFKLKTDAYKHSLACLFAVSEWIEL